MGYKYVAVFDGLCRTHVILDEQENYQNKQSDKSQSARFCAEQIGFSRFVDFDRFHFDSDFRRPNRPV